MSNDATVALVRDAILQVLDDGRMQNGVTGLGWRFDDLNEEIVCADRVDFADKVVEWLATRAPNLSELAERTEERDALLRDLRRCEQQLIAITPVSQESARETALAEALQLVLDDWANGNVILEDAMAKAETALNMPLAKVPEAGRSDWIWSLEQPEVSGVRWIETWDENRMELGVLRITVGDRLPPNVACWRYVEPPSRHGMNKS